MIDLPKEIELYRMEKEVDFKVAWQSTSGDTPIARAVSAGIRADRLSWVFISGYQSAIRLAFAGIPEDEWWSFAVSEDKAGCLPGVQLSHGRLSGTKTWVASCDHVDGVIVTAAGRCYQVSRHAEGVQFERYASASFLRDMSTGKVTLENADAHSAIEMRLDFRLAEPVALMAASAGYLWREATRYREHSLLQGCEVVFNRLAGLVQIDAKLVSAIYSEVAQLGKVCAKIAEIRCDGSEEDWRQNGRLLSLYKKTLAQKYP